MPERYPSWVLREQDAHRVAWLTDLMNAQLLMVLILGFLGLGWHARDRSLWPLVLWFVLSAGVIILLFHPMPRFRLPVVPVLMVLAGAVIARATEGRDRRLDPALDPQERDADRRPAARAPSSRAGA